MTRNAIKEFDQDLTDEVRKPEMPRLSRTAIKQGLEMMVYEGMKCLAFAVAVLVIAIIVMACY